jgi:hypothetical protein
MFQSVKITLNIHENYLKLRKIQHILEVGSLSLTQMLLGKYSPASPVKKCHVFQFPTHQRCFFLKYSVMMLIILLNSYFNKRSIFI